ncbi:hypothetical protein JCM17380_47140 [Desulfosporosinus burensis]
MFGGALQAADALVISDCIISGYVNIHRTSFVTGFTVNTTATLSLNSEDPKQVEKT